MCVGVSIEQLLLLSLSYRLDYSEWAEICLIGHSYSVSHFFVTGQHKIPMFIGHYY